MAEYDKLSEVTYNPAVRAWRFRVKLYRIYPFYSCVTNSGSYYNYIFADEDVRRGKMVEIFVVDVERAYPCFKTTRSPFRLIASRLTQEWFRNGLGMVITTDLGMVISTVAWLGFKTLYNSVDVSETK
ncbi:hypothetical protein YC2023_073497 [Brassica napus]